MIQSRAFFSLLILSCLGLFSSSGPDFFMLGPKSLGMAAADLTGSSNPEVLFWNPAGLALCHKGHLSFGSHLPIRSATLALSSPIITMESPSETTASLFLAACYPVSDRLVLGALWGTPTDYHLGWPGDSLKHLSGNNSFIWQCSLQIMRISGAASYAISDSIALGISINLDKMSFGYELPFGTGQYSEAVSANAISFCGGLRFQILPQLAAGISFTSAPSWDLTGTATMALAEQIGLQSSSGLSRTFSGASRLNVGVTYQASSSFKLAASLTHSNWGDMSILTGTFSDSAWAEIFTNHDLDLNRSSTIQIRLGAEYQVNQTLTLRMGFATDPASMPAKDRNPLFFSLPGFFLTLGGGLNLGNFTLDAALMLPISNQESLTSDQTPYWPGTYSASTLIPAVSISYKF